MSSAKGGSVRLSRINSQIAHEFTQFLLQEVDDKRLKCAQVSRVEASKDFSVAKVHVTTLDPSVDRKALVKNLKGIAGAFRHHLARTLNLRVTPTVQFYFDENAVKTQHLLTLIEKL